jgi:hypothetical protein
MIPRLTNILPSKSTSYKSPGFIEKTVSVSAFFQQQAQGSQFLFDQRRCRHG